MRVLASLALLTIALTGCGGGAATRNEPDAAAVAAVKARADKSHGEHSAPATAGDVVKTEKGESREDAPVKNEVQERRGKVLGVDPEGCTWLEGAATVSVGPQDTRHQTRAAAIEQARAAAVQDFLGVEVKSKFMDFQQEGLRKESRLTEGILQTTRNGRILKEQVLEESYRDAPDCPACLYRVRLKACAVPRDAQGDRDFYVELNVSNHRFLHGDEAKLSVTATRDCWVYLYNVYDLGSKDQTALVVPNEHVHEKRLKAGQTWEYPDDEAKKLGVRLVAELPQAGDEVSAETVRVIASKAALSKAMTSPADGGWLGVLRRLNRANVEWTEDAEAYTIYKR
ncbi:MAG: DUF4384 domain-containing protein [Elusimicrobiota bacterium]|nr:MAG: DUF4384 domain-containing protein [Elusimicrobiota bacterium]